MNIADVLHALIDLVSFGSKANADEAHAAVDEHFTAPVEPAGAAVPVPEPEPEPAPAPAPAQTEGNPS